MAVGAGCQALVSLKSRPVDQLLPGCKLPSTGNGMIRLVNVANVGNADFCFRTSGTSDWGRPVFRDNGDDQLCVGGLPYAQATVPFNVPAGQIDVKAIPPEQACNVDNATSEVDGVAVGDAVNGGAPVVSIVRYAGGSSAEAMSALPEEPGTVSKVGGASHLRFVNALSGGKSINVGYPPPGPPPNNIPALPTTVATLVLPKPIAPGATEPQGTALNTGTIIEPIDSSGYLQFPGVGTFFAASLDPSNSAVALFHTPTTQQFASLYVIGDPQNDGYPRRGLYCNDTGTAFSPSANADAGPDAGPDAGAPSDGLSDQDHALLAPCVPQALPVLSIDTFNVGLYGANAPFEYERRGSVYNAILGRTSDLMCIVEADDILDRTQIANKAAQAQPPQFPYSYMVTTDLTTPPSNPGDVRPVPTTPPCSGMDVASAMQAMQCISANCSTNASDPNQGILDQTTGCLPNQCTPQLAPIYGSACLNCLIYYLTSLQPMAYVSSACTQDNHQPFAFVGQTPSMILSHYPFVDNGSHNAAYILPATGFRRAVLKVQVQLEDQQKIDFFCAHLTSSALTGLLPYTGSYGSGWEDEQNAQAKEVAAWVTQQAKADGVPAIIAGDWQATVGCSASAGADAGADAAADGGAGCPAPAGLGSQSPEVMNYLTTQFVRADPQGYVHQCDDCPSPTNVYNASTMLPLEVTPTFLYGFPKNATTAESLVDTDNSVPIMGNQYSPPPPGNKGPVSGEFPRNVQVLRPH